METEEQILRPPAESIQISDSTLIMKLPTTRRPIVSRPPTPTKKINIVSANTTLVTTDPEEMHDVMSHFIANSHPYQKPQRPGNNRPSNRPGVFEFMSNLINSGLTTSTLAIITLVKTIFMSLFVLLLPPIALTVGIVQAVQG